MKRYLITTVFCLCSFAVISCGSKQMHSTRAAPVLEDNKKYTVTFTSGQNYRLKGCDIIVQGDAIGIKFKNSDSHTFYPRTQIAEISRREGSGGAIGAVVGAAAGFGVGYGISYAAGCKDCEIEASLMTMMSGAGGAVVGGLAGWAIGAHFNKKRIILEPQVYGDNGVKITGGGLGISGRF